MGNFASILLNAADSFGNETLTLINVALVLPKRIVKMLWHTVKVDGFSIETIVTFLLSINFQDFAILFERVCARNTWDMP